ncbi:hypothetical protein CORT_0D02870 [Candida orthopsilosis Co 90-125]|uniref:DUF1749-domain-containing protein n=1 Tax=Candida orthopsilosis (strain 90-125) TaxID=1136231 RepID=H8X539_CANO9|nr:hypothetical protein CORT_0D02870 [Candida orthopsilosis Co 90-125]CCG23132.1 hypothetical protein CORT_0D02870 [Candida orthopsilosis Co 90-125]
MSLSKLPPQEGIVYTYAFNLTAFEFTEYSKKTAPNIILFIGGLSNGLLNVPYLPTLAKAATNFKSQDGEDWNLVQVLLSSAYSGFGTTSLEKDTSQIRKAVEYFRSEAGGKRRKIVLMGHSTGCQNSLHYLTNINNKEDVPDTAKVQGAILQAPVSDSEALSIESKKKEVDALLREVFVDYLSEGKGAYILPEKFRRLVFNTPITAYRFFSLFSKRGDDDFFSSYLTEDDFKKTFGSVTVPLLVLYSGKDQFVPASVDKAALVSRFQDSTPSEYWNSNSKIIEGATHEIGDGSDEGVTDILTESVSKFVSDV